MIDGSFISPHSCELSLIAVTLTHVHFWTHRPVMQHCSCHVTVSTCSFPCAFANTVHHALSTVIKFSAAPIRIAVSSDALTLGLHTVTFVIYYFTATIDVLYYFTISVQITTHEWFNAFMNVTFLFALHERCALVLFLFHYSIFFIAVYHFTFVLLPVTLLIGAFSSLVHVVPRLFHDICS